LSSAVSETPQAVAAAVPAAERSPADAETGTILSRVVWFFLFAAPTAVIVTAATLTPNPVGHGTHTQLGLPPCGFFVVTGYPCPGCGLTTSFAYMAHFDPVGAAFANPFGVMLFLVSFATAIVALLGMVRGWPVIRTLDALKADRWAMLLAGTSLLVWTVKVVTQLVYSL
jgi:hypothetical protein